MGAMLQYKHNLCSVNKLDISSHIMELSKTAKHRLVSLPCYHYYYCYFTIIMIAVMEK